MRTRSILLLLALPAFAVPWACAASNGGSSSSSTTTGGQAASGGEGGSGGSGGSDSSSSSSGEGGSGGSLFEEDGGFITDASSEEPPLSADAACAATASEATVEKLPVDIIWMVDNSSSMEPAVTEIRNGLNAFAALIASKNLDYKVIMLSLRDKETKITYNGGTRYPVCIPEPLAGDADCGNGPRFFQASLDIYSTQPLEQFLGTLGQTTGYQPGDQRGCEPWKQELRPNATKTIVVVTDDNARLSASQFETFGGGKNPFNSLTLPPGILHPSWNGLFDSYIFSGIYGWESNNDPSVICTFPDGTQPPSSGPTYTTLVQKTKGVRAKLCDGSAAWQPFFDAVAQAIYASAKLNCELSIPTPPNGTIDPTLVNVALVSGGQSTYLPGVANAAACGAEGGWYYDDPANPQKVILCKTSCDEAQAMVGPDKPGKIEVLFGCETILK
ncbi:MAG: hypothetical protein IPM54_22315 [Polyangiaceae bacterium]|nr:hypothetical protein [Polyangiaceae bacterium]